MTFEVLKPTRQGRHLDPTKCYVSYVGSVEYGYHIYIKLGRVIVHETWKEFVTKASNNRTSVVLAIHEGRDTDAGFVMLVPDHRGYKFTISHLAKFLAPEDSNATFVCRMEVTKFKHYTPRTAPCELTQVEATIDGNAMLMQLPEWFVYGKNIVPAKTFERVVPVRHAVGGHQPHHTNKAHRR